jgi:hypothetical protein
MRGRSPAPRALVLGLLALLLGPEAQAVGVHDPGEAVLRGAAGALVERRLVLDLWDAPGPPAEFTLREAPDSEPVKGVEARLRPLRGAWGPWRPAEGLNLTAGPGRNATDRGEDGLVEIVLRFRVPDAPATRHALLIVERAPGQGALAITTRLQAEGPPEQADTHASPSPPGPSEAAPEPAAPAAGAAEGQDLEKSDALPADADAPGSLGPASLHPRTARAKAPADPPDTPPPRRLPDLPISLALGGLAAVSLAKRARRPQP